MEKEKHLGLRIDAETHKKLKSLAEFEGRSINGTTIIPFKDKFDKSLKLYSLMTTKPEEVEQREKEGGGSLGRERTERKRESCQ